MIGQSRSTTITAITAMIVVCALLLVVVAALIVRMEPSLERGVAALSGRRLVPPADPALAGRHLRGNPAQSFGVDVYPAEAIRANEQGRTVAKLTIDATGTPVRCIVTQSSGSTSLDNATCRIALKRVKFDPARDSRGAAIASTYTLPVRWVLPE